MVGRAYRVAVLNEYCLRLLDISNRDSSNDNNQMTREHVADWGTAGGVDGNVEQRGAHKIN